MPQASRLYSIISLKTISQAASQPLDLMLKKLSLITTSFRSGRLQVDTRSDNFGNIIYSKWREYYISLTYLIEIGFKSPSIGFKTCSIRNNAKASTCLSSEIRRIWQHQGWFSMLSRKWHRSILSKDIASNMSPPIIGMTCFKHFDKLAKYLQSWNDYQVWIFFVLFFLRL